MSIDISASDAHEYSVELPASSGPRSFIFRVPVEFLEQVAVTDAYEPLLARKSMEYVVEYRVVDQLPDVFGPAEIEAVLPDYRRDITARLTG